MSRVDIQDSDPRHDAAQALAWLDALDPAIRACRLRTRSMGPHILVQALRQLGIEATVVSRCVTSRTGDGLSLKTFSGSSGFIHMPCVQGQLFSFDGFEGAQAWSVALSNRYAKCWSNEHNLQRSPGPRDVRQHTRYLAPGEYGHVANPLQNKGDSDRFGNGTLNPSDAMMLTRLIDHLKTVDLPPAPLSSTDERLIDRQPAARGMPRITTLEARLQQVWLTVSLQQSPLPGSMAPQVSTVAMECFRHAGVDARLLHRRLTYRGGMEVFDIHRIALEFQVPGCEPSLVCLSAPGGWEGLVDSEKQTIQCRPGDYLYAGDIEEIDDLVHQALDPAVHSSISSLFSSYLLELSVDHPPNAPGTRFPRL